MKRLLVATDLSARSDRAVQRAVALAAIHGAELEVLNVVDETLPQSIVDFHEKTAKSAIEAQVWALPTAKGVRAVTRVLRGSGFVDILRHAEEFRADLIVIGIHRHSSRLLFRGTTAERILRIGRMPVLVVREPVVHPYARVLVGIDLSPHSRAALQFAATIAPDAQFMLVHALHVPFKGFFDKSTASQIARDEKAAFDEMMSQDIGSLIKKLGKRAPAFEVVAKVGLPREILDGQAKTFKPDLIAIGTQSRTGIARAILGSLAEEILADAPTDILAVKAW